MAPVPKASSSKSAPKPKPYDKGKGKAVDRGAPATLSQKSRKGKKAWRKNIDVRDEEEALEKAREEERLTGGKFSGKADGELFTIDTTGDVQVAKRLRKAAKPLRSLAVLDERSAIPSLTSKPQVSFAAKQTKLSYLEKERLRRIARKNLVAEDGSGMGSATLSKLESADLHDAWTAKEKIILAEGGFGQEGMNTVKPKVPITIQRQRDIHFEEQVAKKRNEDLPTGGTSYNPTVESHQALLDLAVEEELVRLAQEEKDAERIRELGEVVIARRNARIAGDEMTIGEGEDDDDEGDVDGETVEERKVKIHKRKTQAQRNKKLRARENNRLEKIEKTNKTLLKAIASVPTLKKSVEEKVRAEEERRRIRALAKTQRERRGLEGGEKVGKHRMKKEQVTVQLGEDLAESLRQVKPEGNLFKDRFLTLQKKALIEPRVPQLPKRRAGKTKEYEKHAWKRFV
ncbi:nucleolar protein 53, partial [Tremellales sp. Uapishka_1]